MTRDADFKRRVRARMKHTGENYTTARAGLLARMPPPMPDPSALAPDDQAFFKKTVRAFFDGPRVKSIPMKRKQRVVVLLMAVHGFAPGRRYSEVEVNDVLKVVHDDWAFLRRELVNYGYLARADGWYWIPDEAPVHEGVVAQEVFANEADILPRP